ncbi:MAG: carboxypeptidase regulatory-like domain-containing protein [Hymenobacteraceae bacterium]|nr:carboxypeptidase regulatory-like domain-containing protein [Hymenobacteraceae bacterium]
MAKLPMAQGDLYLVLPLAWQAYRDNQAAFTAYRPAYTDQVAVAGLALLKAAQDLPDDQSRGGAGEKTRRELLPQLIEYLDAWVRLEGYIEAAYGETGYKPMREEAGSKFYEAASGENWDAVTRLITNARGFVKDHLAELTANDNMPTTFPAELEAEAQDAEKLIERFLSFKNDERKGTEAKEAANAAAYAAWQKVARDADRIWRRQPEQRRYFEMEYLLGLVRGTGQAGIRGVLTRADGGVAAGVTVTVPGVPDATTVTDEDGRFALAVPAGTYVVELRGAGFKPLDIASVVVSAGVKKRVDGVVEKAV